MLPNPQFPADLVAFTEEILNGKLNFEIIRKYWGMHWLPIKFRNSFGNLTFIFLKIHETLPGNIE